MDSKKPKLVTSTSTRLLANSLREHLETFQSLIGSTLSDIEKSGQLICDALAGGHKILICGNGGSAADAQHIAAELVGRYEKTRRSFPAIALTTDTSALTAVSNDFGFDEVFARQIAGLAQSGDVLVAISTSGRSANVLKAVAKAREQRDACPHGKAKDRCLDCLREKINRRVPCRSRTCTHFTDPGEPLCFSCRRAPRD